MFSQLRNIISDTLYRRTIDVYGTKMGYRLAPKYAAYQRKCRSRYAPPEVPPPPGLAAAAEHFRADGWASYWLPENNRLANEILGRIKARDASGDQLWDSDNLFTGDLFIEFPEIELRNLCKSPRSDW